MKKNGEAAFHSGGRPPVFWAAIKRLGFCKVNKQGYLHCRVVVL